MNRKWQDTATISIWTPILKTGSDILTRTTGIQLRSLKFPDDTGKDLLLTVDIRQIVESCPDGLPRLRGRALVLIGFAGAFRRSELAAIDVADLSFQKDGLVIDLNRSKTVQESSGRQVGIPRGGEENTCPVRALLRWSTEAEITAGPIFRAINRHGRIARGALHRDSVCWILKQAALRAGMKTDRWAGIVFALDA